MGVERYVIKTGAAGIHYPIYNYIVDLKFEQKEEYSSYVPFTHIPALLKLIEHSLGLKYNKKYLRIVLMELANGKDR